MLMRFGITEALLEKLLFSVANTINLSIAQFFSQLSLGLSLLLQVQI